MTDWKQYEEYEEELHNEITKVTVNKTKKKKTWKQITEEKSRGQLKKKWQKKRRKSRHEKDIK